LLKAKKQATISSWLSIRIWIHLVFDKDPLNEKRSGDEAVAKTDEGEFVCHVTKIGYQKYSTSQQQS